MALLEIREQEWRAYHKSNYIDYFELAEDVPALLTRVPRYELHVKPYTLRTFDEYIAPMSRRYKQIAADAREIAKKHGLHRRLIPVVLSILMLGVRRNDVGMIACLKRISPVEYVTRLASRQCAALFRDSALCADVADVVRKYASETYAYFSFSLCK
jgi:hypothetical protein